MASSTPAGIIPTATTAAAALVALTTPFVQPPSCTNLFATTSLVSSFNWNDYSETTVQIVFSDPANPQFASCQPSGWDNVAPESRFSFSPAVCPSGWTAYDVVASETDISSTSLSTVSTAYCCSRQVLYCIWEVPVVVYYTVVVSF